MQDTFNITFIGGTSLRGISVPGMVKLVRSSSGNKTKVIDLTGTDIDSDVTFAGPPHYYRNAAGLLVMSSANVWPLEYSNGVPVGRHEPEPERKNYQGSSQVSTITGSDFVSSSGTTATTTAGPNGSNVSVLAADRLKSALYDPTAAAWLVAEFTPTASATFAHVIMSGALVASTPLRTYMARRDSATYIYGLSQAVPTGNVTASFFRAVLSAGVAVGMLQVESGLLATSPIDTQAGQTATRAASSVTVNTSDASSITVTYSSGESESYDTPDETFTLPFAKAHWQTRHITTIELRA